MNAVFERDYVRASISPRYLWMRAGLAVAVAGFVGIRLFWAYASENFSDVGDQVFRVSLGSGLVVLLLAAPGSFATVLVHARAQNTLPVLLASPLTPLQFAGGAFAARALGLLLLVLATWPPVALAFVYGGVLGSQLFTASAAVAASLFLTAAPAFVISAFARRTGAAVVAAYLGAAATLTVLAVAGAQIESATGDARTAAALSPLHAIRASLDVTSAAAGVDRGAFVLLGWSLALAVGSVLLAAWRLRSEARGDLEADAAARAVRPPRPLRHENPILDRELRSGGERSRGTARTMLWILATCEAVYFATVLATGDRTSIPWFGGVLTFQCLLLVLAAAAAGATALASEKETGTLDVLRVTPLTPSQIVHGKLAGLLVALLPCLSVPVIHLAWGCVAGIVSPAAIPALLVSGLGVVSAWAIFGMLQSLDQRDPHRAVLRTMGALGIIGIVVAAQVGFPLRAILDDTETYVRATVSFGANPAATMLIGAAAFRSGGSDAETANLPPPGPTEQAGAVIGALVWVAIHLATAWAVQRRLVHTYRTRFEG